MLPYSSLPALNAGLNATTTLLILLGYWLIKQKAWTGHALCMILAMITSTLFLISYLIYHAHHGSTPFPGQGWIRPVYFSILITHTILAVVIVPMVLRTFYFAVRGRFDRHLRLARWTFPIWLYVSVTGVVIYWMLYRLPLLQY
ncbi:MAG: DUF420 domain-containing protein [Candidatus Omnitrophica bacterium]|nr:DUF420 domain-containing protein [Candidatus Omnitrophota bacterium]